MRDYKTPPHPDNASFITYILITTGVEPKAYYIHLSRTILRRNVTGLHTFYV